MGVIHRLGFVQVDSVNTVERAHNMILFSRRPAFRPNALQRLIEKDRMLFEHWTHDASVIPVEFYPYWHLRFERQRARLAEKWRNWQGEAYLSELSRVLDHVADHGPVRSADLIAEEHKGQSGGWWNWHPSKAALEYLWHTGQLAVSGRQNFQKFYDLPKRCFPHAATLPPAETESAIEWFCSEALTRLGFATSGEIAAFWDQITPQEAKAWVERALTDGRIEEIDIEGVDGKLRKSVAWPGAIAEAAALPPPPARVRILSPFDPALRDRKRADRLFGFFYRIEIFVPEAKRQYGYYVFPILEGDRLIGRIDMKADRNGDTLAVSKLWLEPGARPSKGRLQKLEAELDRMARFINVGSVSVANDFEQ